MSFIGGRIIANDVLVLRVRNTNATPRFLFSISFDGDHHGYTNDMLHNHAFTVGTTSYDLTLANQFYPRESKTAVKQLGKRDYNSDFRYIHFGFTFPVGGVGTWFGVSAAWMGYRDDEAGSTSVYQMINELSLIQKQVSFTCVRLTNILIGDKVKFKDQSSREIEGLVVGINNIDEDKQKVLVRVLKQ
jgi:hypothetical protein